MHVHTLTLARSRLKLTESSIRLGSNVAAGLLEEKGVSLFFPIVATRVNLLTHLAIPADEPGTSRRHLERTRRLIACAVRAASAALFLCDFCTSNLYYWSDHFSIVVEHDRKEKGRLRLPIEAPLRQI
jgi:hypothetical protein